MGTRKREQPRATLGSALTQPARVHGGPNKTTRMIVGNSRDTLACLSLSHAMERESYRGPIAGPFSLSQREKVSPREVSFYIRDF